MEVEIIHVATQTRTPKIKINGGEKGADENTF
jgi:hypothetical protein